ncbi:hypothetical protein FGK63_01640 [Ruegeria sediminis]|uniref:Uncharacterized protein n=1 Tax=Ruegeria sediminis TaxID=2583820 RepID=A0ABY2X376_9RHOB|nr:hypothetical protein [Ruegeria sediminis]TMV09798.1 hypothetical protein FGK63_01640 [Ruegeria sediminis]
MAEICLAALALVALGAYLHTRNIARAIRLRRARTGGWIGSLILTASDTRSDLSRGVTLSGAGPCPADVPGHGI